MQYEGKIIKILPIEKVGKNQTEKRTVILEENRDSEYKGGISFDLWGEKMSMIEGHNVGETITAHLNARAREYNGKWYNSISAWKIEGVSSAEAEGFVPAENDDLPF